MATESVRYELEGRVAVICIDDGKVNALSPAVLAAVGASLDRAEAEAQAVLLSGRPGRFSAGFDLSVMAQGGDAARSLVTAGAELALRLHELPLPVVAACTGHALAMGALLLLASDLRIGASGDFKIGLNEVAIGMTLPLFGVELARERLSPRQLTRAVASAEIYAPEGAREAGFLDRVTRAEDLLDAARTESARLAELPGGAFRNTKRRLHGPTIARIRETLAEDMKRMGAPPQAT